MQPANTPVNPTNPQSNDYITEAMLTQFGISYAPDEIASLLEHVNATVDERIGAEVTSLLSDEELEELLDIQDTGTQEDVADWITEMLPDYSQIIDDNIAITLGEIAENIDSLQTEA